MLVKIRLPRDVAGGRMTAQQKPFLSGLGGLIVLLAFSCLMLAMWRLTSDLGWTDEFVITSGILSHWQVWMAIAIGFGALGVRLNKYVKAMGTPGFAAGLDPEPSVSQEAASEDTTVGPRVA